MRVFYQRLLVPVACFVLVVAAGYSAMSSELSAPFEAAATGIALLAFATVLRRATEARARTAQAGLRGLVPASPRLVPSDLK